jgi:5-methylcytosine-specific restriction endonuclease McrA
MSYTAVNRYGNGHRRRQLRAVVLAEEDECWLCHRPVDPELKHPHPWSATIDEVVPVSKGGSPYSRDNVRLAHRVCNIRRGNGTRTRQRPAIAPFVTSRRW